LKLSDVTASCELTRLAERFGPVADRITAEFEAIDVRGNQHAGQLRILWATLQLSLLTRQDQLSA
jgi:hypothetical protein